MYTTQQLPGAELRVDSPMDNRHALLDQGDADNTANTERPPISRSRSSTSRSTHSQTAETTSNVRFVVVDHPDKLRDREELRKNRKHVMIDYLEKARVDPLSTDPRVSGGSSDRKRRRMQSPQASTSDAEGAVISSYGTLEVTKDPTSSRPSLPKANSSRAITTKPLVAGISGRFRNYHYLGTAPEDVPFPLSTIGRGLNPFDTMPTFSDSSINVSELKWSCSRRFGSKVMADCWVPMLLRARHAFLSTICISAAHDDIMRRSARHPGERPKTESIERTKVRQEVTQMINESMTDPEMQTADATIVAVLHLLNSEIMGCDDSVMHMHERGLHSMISQRGGLNELGVKGQLAAITTITMYLIAVLRETTPHNDFVAYASRQDTRPPKDSRQLPESPLYCRLSGFDTVCKVVPPGSDIYRLLEASRRATSEFLAMHHSARKSTLRPPSFRQTTLAEHGASLERAAKDILASPRAAELVFSSESQRYTYEAIRLTARIYVQALHKRIPFSEAARELSTPASPAAKSAVAIHIRVRNALMKTDTTDCWGHMAGVLFWIVLVAGAAANPNAAEMYVARREVGEEEEARKWLAAIVVRCSILLGFEHGAAITETMKRMIAVQQALTRAATPRTPTVEEQLQIPGTSSHGLAIPPPMQQVQRGFADFAEDFLAT